MYNIFVKSEFFNFDISEKKWRNGVYGQTKRKCCTDYH